MSRFQQIAEKLDAYGIDAMLITSKPNLLYASQFVSSGSMAVVTRDGSYFFADSRYIEAAGREVQDAQLRLICAETPSLALANEVIAKHGIRKLGIEDEYATLAEYSRWKAALSCELIPATGLLAELRQVKEPEEIENLIAAQRIAEKALTETLEQIKVGRTEKEISAYLQYRILAYGAEKMSFDPIVVSGANSSLPHGSPTDKPLADGEFLTMDFGCVYNGYCSDMTRTVAIGYVTEEMDRVYHTVLEAQLAGIAAARAGVTGRAVHEAAAGVIGAAGYGPYFVHGFGHGVGVQCHEKPVAALSNDRPLPAGAVISAEPGIYLPGRFGVRIEDVIIVGERESQSIMKAPKELLVLK